MIHRDNLQNGQLSNASFERRSKRSCLSAVHIFLVIAVFFTAVAPLLCQDDIEAIRNELSKCMRSPNRDNFQRYQESNQEWKRRIARNPKAKRLVFLGDSITDRWKLEKHFNNPGYINRGIDGQITGQMLARFKQDVIDLNPEVVIILGGANDMSFGFTDEAIRNNLSMMCQLAQFNSIKPILASILPINDYHRKLSDQLPPHRIAAINQWIRSYASEHHIGYLDYFSQIVDQDGFLGRELSDDGVHPNEKGYQIMAAYARAEIKKYVH
jgi:lysophospholipase L1-like esterase